MSCLFVYLLWLLLTLSPSPVFQTIWDCFFFPWPFQNRQQFRSKYGYEHAGFNDCIAQCCCTCCMVNQEVREFALRNGTQPRYMTAPSI